MTDEEVYQVVEHINSIDKTKSKRMRKITYLTSTFVALMAFKCKLSMLTILIRYK